jgi:hypothetical protein
MILNLRFKKNIKYYISSFKFILKSQVFFKLYSCRFSQLVTNFVQRCLRPCARSCRAWAVEVTSFIIMASEFEPGSRQSVRVF